MLFFLFDSAVLESLLLSDEELCFLLFVCLFFFLLDSAELESLLLSDEELLFLLFAFLLFFLFNSAAALEPLLLSDEELLFLFCLLTDPEDFLDCFFGWFLISSSDDDLSELEKRVRANSSMVIYHPQQTVTVSSTV